MCKLADKTVVALMKAIEPTLVQLLTLEGVASTTEGTTAINAFNAALAAVEAWVPGTTAQDVIQVINAFVAVFDTLPIPTEVQTLVSLITGGIEAVITVLTANSPAPTAPAGTSAEEEAAAQSVYAHSIGIAGEAKVEAMTGVKLSLWDKARAALGDYHVGANKYKSSWNKSVEVLVAKDKKYTVLEQ